MNLVLDTVIVNSLSEPPPPPRSIPQSLISENSGNQSQDHRLSLLGTLSEPSSKRRGSCARVDFCLGSFLILSIRPNTPSISLQNPPLRLLKKYKAPVIYIKDWTTDFPRILGQEAALNLKEKIERRVALVEWYEGFKLEMRKQLVEVTKRKFGLMD